MAARRASRRVSRKRRTTRRKRVVRRKRRKARRVSKRGTKVQVWHGKRETVKTTGGDKVKQFHPKV